METRDYKYVSDYCNISFEVVEKMDCFTFFYYLREAFIYYNSITKEGIKYLNNAWRLEQTEMDTQRCRELFGRKEE